MTIDHLTAENITQNTNHYQYRSFEHLTCTVQSGLDLLYCPWNILPPQGTQEGITNTTFLDELTDLLTEVTAKHRSIIILGDLNMHIDKSEDPDAQVLINTLVSFNSKQHIPFQTHNK